MQVQVIFLLVFCMDSAGTAKRSIRDLLPWNFFLLQYEESGNHMKILAITDSEMQSNSLIVLGNIKEILF